MAAQNVIVINAAGNGYQPLPQGNTIPVGAVPLSVTAGNSITANPDGLYSSGADPATIAAVFNDCTGAAQVPGAQIPTCAEMNAAITAAIGTITDLHLTGASFNGTTQVLTLTMSDSTTYTADLSELKSVVVGAGLTGDGTTATPVKIDVTAATAVAPTTGTDIPLDIMGGRTMLMGTPVGYISIDTDKVVPYYAKAA